MAEWLTGLRPTWWEAVLATVAIWAFWLGGPFLVEWAAVQLKTLAQRAVYLFRKPKRRGPFRFDGVDHRVEFPEVTDEPK